MRTNANNNSESTLLLSIFTTLTNSENSICIQIRIKSSPVYLPSHEHNPNLFFTFGLAAFSHPPPYNSFSLSQKRNLIKYKSGPTLQPH